MISKPYFRQLVSELPHATCAVTRHVVTGELVGIAVNNVHEGVMVLDPWTSNPVSWHDVDGIPHYGKPGGHSTGSYRSQFISRDALTALLKVSP